MQIVQRPDELHRLRVLLPVAQRTQQSQHFIHPLPVDQPVFQPRDDVAGDNLPSSTPQEAIDCLVGVQDGVGRIGLRLTSVSAPLVRHYAMQLARSSAALPGADQRDGREAGEAAAQHGRNFSGQHGHSMQNRNQFLFFCIHGANATPNWLSNPPIRVDRVEFGGVGGVVKVWAGFPPRLLGRSGGHVPFR